MGNLKSYCVVFIPKCYDHHDDPSDFKQWEDVDATNSNEAAEMFEDHATIVRVTEN